MAGLGKTYSLTDAGIAKFHDIGYSCNEGQLVLAVCGLTEEEGLAHLKATEQCEDAEAETRDQHAHIVLHFKDMLNQLVADGLVE